jgi:RanBP-type and C3HC4-type zinc finger-containing protein 1
MGDKLRRDCLAHVIEFSDDAVVGCPYRDDDYACDSTMQEREIKAVTLPLNKLIDYLMV